MRRPRLLDLFCGAGGAARGYQLAGFHVTGVDTQPQPRYAGDAFVRGDALSPPVRLESFDAIHASPPCQAYTAMSNRWRGHGGKADERPDLVAATRALLQSSGKPYVIENVRGAPLEHPIELTGEMFGLRVHRPRLFECNPFMLAPAPAGRQRDPVAVYGKAMDGRLLWRRSDGTEQRAPRSLGEPSEAMGIDWMEWDELREAIPPAYTKWIGERLLETLALRVA